MADFESDRCWFKRAWTLQEISGQWIIGGDMGGEKDLEEDVRAIFQEQLASLENIMPITGAQCVCCADAHAEASIGESRG